MKRLLWLFGLLSLSATAALGKDQTHLLSMPTFKSPPVHSVASNSINSEITVNAGSSTKSKLLIASTVNGNLHAIDASSGTVLWKVDSGEPFISSYQSPKALERVDNGREIPPTIIPNVDGSLLLIGKDGAHSKGVHMFGMSASELVDNSPFNLANGVFIVGSKSSKIYGIDSTSGIIKHFISSVGNSVCPEEMRNFDEENNTIWIARSDYTVRAFEGTTELWNFTVSDVKSPFTSSFDMNSNKDSNKIRATLGGDVYDENMMWKNNLEGPIYGIFENGVDRNGNKIISRLDVPVSVGMSDTLVIGPGDRANMPPLNQNKGNPAVYINRLSPNGDMVGFIVNTNLDIDTLNTLSPLQNDILLLPAPGDNKESDVEGFYYLWPPETDTVVKFNQNRINPPVSTENGWTVIVWLLPIAVITVLIIIYLSLLLRKSKSLNSSLNAIGQTDSKGNLTIGSLVVEQDKVLGYGSHGTVVFKGTLDGRPVAIKRMLKSFYHLAKREIKLLISSDGHQNVVRYFAKEESVEFIYLSLELCVKSLGDAISDIEDEGVARDIDDVIPLPSAGTIKFMHELASGVAHLHSLHIVHRDLKPFNILLIESKNVSAVENGEEGEIKNTNLGLYRPKISDMGLGKQLENTQSSFGNLGERRSHGGNESSVGRAPGSVGWQAPEVMRLLTSQIGNISSKYDSNSSTNSNGSDNKSNSGLPMMRRTRSVDIFSLGCIFYYILDSGRHVYGDWFEREANMIRGNAKHLNRLKSSPTAFDLVSSMLSLEPSVRPPAQEVLKHPFFWNHATELQFLCDISDQLEREEPGSEVHNYLDSNSKTMFGNVNNTWDKKLHPCLLADLGKYRKYQYNSVKDLLRVIRNKKNHYRELDDFAKTILGDIPNGFYTYFAGKFPQLFVFCYQLVKRYFIHEKVFRDHLGLVDDDLPSPRGSVEDPIISISLASPSNKNNKNLLNSNNNNNNINNAIAIENNNSNSLLPLQMSNTKHISPPPNKVKASSSASKVYKTKPCKDFAIGSCAKGEKCTFIHGESNVPMESAVNPRAEILRLASTDRAESVSSPVVATIPSEKRKVCRYFSGGGKCDRGDECGFIHIVRDKAKSEK